MKNLIYCLFAFILLGCSENSNDFELQNIDPLNPVYLDANGITIKAKDWAVFGDSGSINGVTYTIVKPEALFDMVRQGADVTKVCTSRITAMPRLFSGQEFFNQNISSWDVSNVTDMYLMFTGATYFNEDLSAWDVSSVSDFTYMFFEAEKFNQDISAWDVSSATNMYNMFRFAYSFNQDISEWDVSSVTHMSWMFLGASSFNQDLSEWDVRNVSECSSFSDETPDWALPKPNLTCN